MGKLEAFQIVFDHPQGVFYAGNVVSGHVKLILSEAIKMRGITMKIFGRGKVHWSVASGKSRKHYRSEEVYFDWRLNLVQPDPPTQDSLTLQAGSFSFPFQMSLPSTLPSSFEGKYGHVRYLAEVKIDRPWKFDHEAKAAFTVLGILNLNTEQPCLREPKVLHLEKDVGYCCCCMSGIVDATVMVNRQCFVPGETIYISAKITNNSNSLIPYCTAVMQQKTEFLAQHSMSFFSSGRYHSKVRIDVVAKVELGSIAEGATVDWRNIGLLVPSIPPSHLVGCQIINVSYQLVFDVNVHCTEFKLPVEVIIGTIPLRGHYSPSSVITTQPPPPSFTTQNFGGMMPPPPFPNDSTTFYDMPPPSYEECIQGRVTIKEETDSEYVHGDLNWAPVYPMYHTSDSPTAL